MAIYKSKYTGKQVDSILDNVENKQNILTPGRGIDIQNDVISLSDDTEYSTLDDRITDVENAISNIGGVNYNDFYSKEIKEYTINSNSDFGDYAEVCYCSIYPLNNYAIGDNGYEFLIREDTDYITLSTYIKSERNLDPYIKIYTDDGGEIYIRQKEFKASDDYSRYYTTIDITDYPNITGIYLIFTPFPEDYGNDIIVSYYGGQIEKGKVLTDCSYPIYSVIYGIENNGERLSDIENKLSFIGTSNLLTKDERIDIPILQTNELEILKTFTPNDFTYKRLPNDYILSFKLGTGYSNPNYSFYLRIGGSSPTNVYAVYNDKLKRYIIRFSANKLFDLSGYLYVKNLQSTPSDPDYIENLQLEIGEIPSDYHKVINSEQVIKISWSDLKSKRDNGELIPGMQYRITDYVTTTIQAYTQSAGHPFDVIVTADSTDVLNENARAIQHNGDEYFINSNLVAWQLWYCLDNDTNRFSWADSTNGKGVIYRMIDEYDNECPYDFKNIQFKRYAVTNITSTKLTSGTLNNLKSILIKDSNGGLYFATKDSYGNFVPLDTDGTSYEINENDSNWYYTFQGISSADGSTINKMYDLTVETFKLTDECISYLEGDGSGANIEDYCRENKIEQFNQEYFSDDIYYKGRQILNNIVFIGGLNYCYQDEYSYWKYNTSSIYGNRFGVNCNSNTFRNNCFYNTFGNSFQCNTFGNNCFYNTFGDPCQYNTLGNNFQYNTFGNSCKYNIFLNDFQYNTLGNNFQYNTFGNGCSYNTFRNNYYYNTFGNSCNNNTFGNGCSYNTFGNYCYNNILENDCNNNTFGNYYKYNTFENSCSYIKVQKDYVYYIIVENGNNRINITSSQTTSSSKPLRNFTLAQGVNNTTTTKTISHNTVGDTFKTTYQPANSSVENI